MNKEDEQFIKNVRKKIIYLEKERTEKERIIQYKKSKLKKKIKIVLNILLLFCIIAIPVIVKVKLDSAFIFIDQLIIVK